MIRALKPRKEEEEARSKSKFWSWLKAAF